MHRPLFVVAIVILDFCTALPIKATIILPDVFTPLSILLVAILLLRTQKIHRAHSIVAAGIIIMSCCFHYTNLYIVGTTLAGIALLRLLKRGSFTALTWRRIMLCAALLPASWLVAGTINFSVTGKFFFARSSNIFLVGHFVHDGTMRKFLCEECPKKNYQLCPYRDSLVGMDFLWDWNRSPLYKTGGWEQTGGDYDQMLHDLFGNPRWWPLLTQKALGQSAQQFFSFSIQPYTEAPPQGEGTPPASQVGEHYTNELNLYFATLQKGGSLNFEDQNNRQSWLLFATVLVFVIFVFRMRRQFPELARVVVFICLALYLNALVCGAVSISSTRYQSRVVWIAPLLALVILAESGILTKLAERIPFGENQKK